MRTFSVWVEAQTVKGGVTYTAKLGSDFEVENSGQVTDAYETLWGMVYRALDLAIAKMPAGKPNGSSNAPRGEVGAPPGTEFVKVDSIESYFDRKGSKVIGLKGGRYSKFGVTLYPEKFDWLIPFGYSNPAELQPGNYQMRVSCFMAVTSTTDGKIILNGLYEKPLVS